MIDLAVLENDVLARIREVVSADTVLRSGEPMAKHTTLRVGGPADIYAEPGSEEDLACLARFCSEASLPWQVIGRGSNLLVRDGGVRGLVVYLAHPHFSRITIADSLITAGAGCRLKHIAVEARRKGLAGLEFLEGIPGNVGGALRMNAGAMGSSMFDVTSQLRVMDKRGDIRELPASDLPIQYRSCPFLKDHIALSARLRGRPDAPKTIERRMRICSQKRWESQPAAPSAGCMFKNPPDMPAGKLVEELGLKGTRHGDAVISDVHGNFILNEGRANAQDVIALIELIRERARAERGICLETEVQIIGEP